MTALDAPARPEPPGVPDTGFVSADAARPDAPCAHCGLPVGSHPVRSEGAAFCCTGCSVVYAALGAAGFGATYYRLRALAPGARAPERPAQPDPLHLGELDTDAFLAEHTRPAADSGDFGDPERGARRVDLLLDGVHCAACVWLVERIPHEMAGVTAARLDLPRARLALTFDPAEVKLSAVAQWLARFGYAARPLRSGRDGERTEAEHRLLIRMGVTWALAGNVMLIAFALYSGLDAEASRLADAARWVSLALAVPALGYGAAPFFRRAWGSAGLAWRARDARHLHIDTPIALGIAVGALHSAWATVTGEGAVWFDSITVLIAALLTARWLQLRARRLAGDATERLLALVPSVVRRVQADGSDEVVPLEDVGAGDVIAVASGEVAPVDGVVVDGASRVNNAMLTGESRPVAVAVGDTVRAGATNLSAPIRLRTKATGAATRVGRLLAWVQADGERPGARVVLLADRVSGYFSLAVLGLAVLCGALWAWLDPALAPQHVVALLVITCPCALGMATPLALAVASGRAASAGIFVKSDEATQLLTEVTTIVLDKTGTLTEGAMRLTGQHGDASALRLAAALEVHSTHPLASALVDGHARISGGAALPDVEQFEAVAGCGVRGCVEGRAVRVGRLDWAERSAEAPPDLALALRETAAAGHTPVAIAVDGVVRAVYAIGDALREDAAAQVARWQAEGYRVAVCSGDHPEAVQTVAHAVGIAPEAAHGGVTPEGKRAFVEALRDQGAVVLMVGDGVNDAAALRAADVGVAVGGGSAASLVAADVFLTRSGLAPLGLALHGARHAMRVVRRGLALSLAYNLAGAGLALAGLVTPLVAAIAMPISSLLVVTSAIAQRSFRPAGSPPADASDPPGRPYEATSDQPVAAC